MYLRGRKVMKKIYSKIEKFVRLVKKSIYFAWHRHHFLIPPSAMKKYIKSFFVVLKRGNNVSNLYTNQKAYLKWIEDNKEDIKYKKFKYNPLMSFIVPVYNAPKKLLCECIDSLLNQSYDNFEICIVDDYSTSIETIEALKEYEKNKKINVIYRKENGMISKASNDAIKMAKGEFIVLVDNDDTIENDALYYFVEALNNNKKLDLIYSDEDKLDYNGKRMEPHFKPDWSPDTFMCLNYICHLTAIRRSIVNKIGGFRSEYDGSQDYDLFLRVVDVTDNIYHVPKILYHWRQTRTSTAGYLGNKSYAYLAGKRALEDTLKRRKIKGKVYDNSKVSTYLVEYEHNNPKVSIIILMKDKAKITKSCLESLYNKMTYKNFEIIIVDNGSIEDKTKEMLNYYKDKYDNFKFIRIESEFNYSYLNNEAVKKAKGEYILLLNNDTEVKDADFLDKMVGYGMQQHVGCVGIKLLYKDKKVQHAGVVLGYGGVAGHIFVPYSYNDVGLFGRLAMPYNYTAVTAACLLIKKSKFAEVNGFDENLKVALNDVDFCLKVLERGYYNVCLSNVEMYHYESRSRGYEVTKEKQERYKKEESYMINKWGKKLDDDKYFSKNNL
jgi:O-antigen biosynthesis protein